MKVDVDLYMVLFIQGKLQNNVELLLIISQEFKKQIDMKLELRVPIENVSVQCLQVLSSQLLHLLTFLLCEISDRGGGLGGGGLSIADSEAGKDQICDSSAHCDTM